MNNEIKIVVTMKIALTDHLSKSIKILTIPRLTIFLFFLLPKEQISLFDAATPS
jgi:hypothetical protein